MVRAVSGGSAIPSPPEATADTVTVLSGVSRMLSTALIVTFPALSVSPGGIVSVRPELNRKSPAAAGGTAAADTVRVTASLDAPDRTAVTVAVSELPLSRMVAGVRTSVAAGVASSSVMVPMPSSFDALPANIAFDGLVNRISTVSFASSTSSPVTVTPIVLLVSPGANVSVPPASVP